MDGYAFKNQNVESVVGNGRLIARSRAGSVHFIFDGPAASLALSVNGEPLDARRVDTLARPGNTRWAAVGAGAVTHAAAPDATLYVVLVEAEKRKRGRKGEPTTWALEAAFEVVTAEGKVLTTPAGRAAVWGAEAEAATSESGHGTLAFTLQPGGRAAFLVGTPEALKRFGEADPFEAVAAWEAGYRSRGLVLKTPDRRLGLAVDFMKYHMQLGYDWRPAGEDGGKMVCDIFRWRDVWSRDFGSGFGPGAIVAGMYEAVARTLEYEVARYTAHPPAGLKVSEDTSQGGSVEGLGWLMKLVWRYYKHTADRAFLRRMLKAFEPWMDEWIARDADDDGLVVDVTEWMDHSRFLRLPEGQRTLYSNVLYYAALRRFRHLHEALGHEGEAEGYRALGNRTRKAIHDAFWNEAGYFNNAEAWGIADTALMLADNCLAVSEGIASKNERFRTLETVRERCWRRFGSVTCDLPMKYVAPDNDHNVKVWPWWMAHEAKARFLNYDVGGGLHVLDKILDTLERPELPGLCEEYLHPDDGHLDAEAGHAFITGAGATLDAILYGLVGLSHREPGDRALRLAPQVPRRWTEWSADVELFKGRLLVERQPDAYRITLTNTRVEALEVRIPPREGVLMATLDGATVEPVRYEEGASDFVLFELKKGGKHTIEVHFAPVRVQAGEFAMPALLPAPLAVRLPALMDEPRLFADVLQGFVVNAVSFFGQVRHVAAHELDALVEPGGDGAPGAAPSDPLLVIVGNEMPFETKRGEGVTPMLDRYLAAGGSLLLLGPRFGRMDPRDDFHGPEQMGGLAGMFWWKVWREGRWVDYDPQAARVTETPEHRGTVYWGPGPLFAAWEHGYGLFGFEAECRGVYDVEGKPVDAWQPVEIAYTDFAVRKPWQFHPLAFTERVHSVVTGPRPERYPCAALLINEATGARIVVVAPQLCSRADLLHRILASVVTPARAAVGAAG